MRWWVSALLAACTAPAPPRPVCEVAAPSCAAAPDDDAAVALAAQRCTPCHAAGGRGGIRFDSAAAMRAAPIETVLATCEMPPSGLDPAARGQLIAWARCRR